MGKIYSQDWRLCGRATVSGQSVEYLRPAPNDLLQRWPVSKRVNSSKADADDPTLIEAVRAIAQ